MTLTSKTPEACKNLPSEPVQPKVGKPHGDHADMSQNDLAALGDEREAWRTGWRLMRSCIQEK